MIFQRISNREAQPAWGFTDAVYALATLFLAGVLIGTALAYILAAEQAYMPLLGWTMGAALALGFLRLRFGAWLQVSQRKQGEGLVPSENAKNVKDVQPEQPEVGVQTAFLMLLVGVAVAITVDVVGGRVAGQFAPEPELISLFWLPVLYQQPIPLFDWLLAFLFMVIAQPLAEEWVFRGVFQPLLRWRFGSWVGYLLTAALTGGYHLLAYTSGANNTAEWWYGVIAPILMALCFGAVKLYTGSTWAAVLAHAGFGLFALAKMAVLTG